MACELKLATTPRDRSWKYVTFVMANLKNPWSALGSTATSLQQIDSRHAGSEISVYNGVGNLAEIHYPDGETLETLYDLRGRPTQERYWLANGSLLRTIGLTYDAAGRVYRLLVRTKKYFWSGITEMASMRPAWWDGTVGIGSLEWIEYGNGLRRTFELKPGLSLIESYRASQNGGRLYREHTNSSTDRLPTRP